MSRFSRTLPIALLACLFAVAVAACKPAGPSTDAGEETTKAAATGADAPTIPGIPELPTQKDQASYMMGMALARQIKPIKDDVDIDVVFKALKTSLADDKLLLTDAQAVQVGEAFTKHLETREMEKRLDAARKNAADGKAFLAANAKKPEVKTTESGLQYQVLSPGTGPKPKGTDTVRVNYKGQLLDGTVFDDTAQHGQPAELPLAQVVPGWKEGIELMPVGSKYRFWIPADLGYGEQGTPGGPIPPNSTLVFEVELLDIVQPGK